MDNVNTDKSLDPDFGNIVPPMESAFWASVVPEDKSIAPYKFILMMPIITSDDSYNSYVEEAVLQLVGEDASVTLNEFDHENFSKLSKATLIACFRPESPREFVWLLPPIPMRH